MLAAPLPRQRSEAQRLASRRNGARSRGPVTAEGRARASRNAFRHGLRAAALLAPGEDPAAFEALLDSLRAEHAPTDATRELLVERLAATLWKLRRCDRLEAELAACRPRPPAGRIYPDGTPVLLTRSAELSVLSAHAARLERALHRLLAALAGRRPADRRSAAHRAGAPTGLDSQPVPAPTDVPTNDRDGAAGFAPGQCRAGDSADGPEAPVAGPSPTGDGGTLPSEIDAAPRNRDTAQPIRTNEPELPAAPHGPAIEAGTAAGGGEAESPVGGRKAGLPWDEKEFRVNEPDAAATRAATASGTPIGGEPRARDRVAGPALSGGEGCGSQGAEGGADGAEPDPEARLLARARTDPVLALAIAEQLAARGELARLRRLLPHLRLGRAEAHRPSWPEPT